MGAIRAVAVIAPEWIFPYADARDNNVKQISGHAKDPAKIVTALTVGAPCFSRGKLDFSPAEKESILKWALAPAFSVPGAKARGRKRIVPRINAGAPTKKYTSRVTHSISPQPLDSPLAQDFAWRG